MSEVFQKDAALLKVQRYWGAMTEPSNILVQTVNRIARNTQVLRTIKREAIIFQNQTLPGVVDSVLTDMAKTREAKTQSPLNKTQGTQHTALNSVWDCLPQCCCCGTKRLIFNRWTYQFFDLSYHSSSYYYYYFIYFLLLLLFFAFSGLLQRRRHVAKGHCFLAMWHVVACPPTELKQPPLNSFLISEMFICKFRVVCFYYSHFN